MKVRHLCLLAGLALASCNESMATDLQNHIYAARLAEENPPVSQVSTEELLEALASESATVVDVRTSYEYARGHIPGALNVPEGNEVEKRISRVVNGNKSAPIILYCNGPFCNKSRRVSRVLVEADFTRVSRYQLGIPVWRALGGFTEIELEGFRYIVERDQTAVLIDARDGADFKYGSLPGARSIPFNLVRFGKGEVTKAKKDGRLPADHHTRILVFANNVEEAKSVADALAKGAFPNTSYISQAVEVLMRHTRQEDVGTSNGLRDTMDPKGD